MTENSINETIPAKRKSCLLEDSDADRFQSRSTRDRRDPSGQRMTTARRRRTYRLSSARTHARSVRSPLAIITALVAIVTVWAPAGSAAASRPADTVFLDGYVYTVDRQSHVGNSLAVRDGVIVFVGSKGRVKRFIGEGTVVVNLQVRMVMPGRGDGHIHSDPM